MSKLHIDTDGCRAYLGGNDVMLTTGEFRVVVKLASRPGRHVAYREIYDVVQRPGFFAGEGVNGVNANVRSMIKRIRRKFEKVDPEFDAIKNYMAHGYVLDANIMAKPSCCPTCGQTIINQSLVTVGLKAETVARYDGDTVDVGWSR